MTHPHPTFVPGSDEIHIWQFCLDRPSEQLVDLERLLSPVEHERTSRLQQLEFRNRFIASKGLTRKLLHRYLHIQPGEITFTFGPFGKPSLANHDSSLHFNLTHSAGRALLAVARQPVGVDLEIIRTDLDIQAIASSVLTPKELSMLLNAPQDRNRIFHSFWVRKEAVMKASGMGMSLNPTGFSVVTEDSGLETRFTNNEQYVGIPSFHVFDLNVGLDAVASLAVADSPHLQLKYFDADVLS